MGGFALTFINKTMNCIIANDSLSGTVGERQSEAQMMLVFDSNFPNTIC